ncbi:MAG: hypothetical protein CMG74_07135 [Candidatus Marinimicrobia bacterium]|nr:hypothetical protein [Candidatus Neomarinimicrobiota bacterium]
MRSIIHIPIVLFLLTSLNGQNDLSKESKSVQGAFGAVTIDGKIWNQIALRPILPFGKLAIAFDFVLYIDQDGNIHDDDWDFSSGEKIKNTLLDKIYYVRYGNRKDPYYFRAGALDYVYIGYGILANGYSNSILYPQVRKVGLEAKARAFDLNFFGFTNDFKENFGLTGIRVSGRVPGGLTMGISYVSDRNQYLGLKDRDGDGRPDLVDDFPDNKIYWLDTDGDGWADNDTINEFDVDGDGWTDPAFTYPIYGIVIDNDGVPTKPEPINIKKQNESIQSFAIDFGRNIFSQGNLTIHAYSQIAALIGKTTNPKTLKRDPLGIGLTPLGISALFGPAKFSWEYRMMPNGKFEFGYFNRSYEIERATFSSLASSTLQGNTGTIVTKANKLGRYGKQNGYFSRLTIDLGSFLQGGFSYQNLQGEQWHNQIQEFEEETNQSFTATIRLRKSVSRIKTANWFYQQRNVPNPFEFEYSESTITGYRIGLQLGNGMILNYIFRRSFRDLNGDGDVIDKDEMLNMTGIETSFSF